MTPDIRKPLKKLLPFLTKAAEDNLNEVDTLQRVVKVFEDVLGYDAMTEISRESSVKDKFCDLALKLDGTIKILVEVKSAATVLRTRHIDQAQSYAANSNICWVLLTNGVAWNMYHLTFDEGIEALLAFSLDLGKDVDVATEQLALMHRQSVKRGELLGPLKIRRQRKAQKAAQEDGGACEPGATDKASVATEPPIAASPDKKH